MRKVDFPVDRTDGVFPSTLPESNLLMPRKPQPETSPLVLRDS